MAYNENEIIARLQQQIQYWMDIANSNVAELNKTNIEHEELLGIVRQFIKLCDIKKEEFDDNMYYMDDDVREYVSSLYKDLVRKGFVKDGDQ
jgi:hypothetical protein